MWYLYVLQSLVPRPGDKPGFYYVGISKDPTRRLHEHNHTTKGAKFTSKHRPFVPRALYGPYETQSEALKAELALKKRSGARRTTWSSKHSALCKGVGSRHPWVENPTVEAFTILNLEEVSEMKSEETTYGEDLSSKVSFDDLVNWSLPFEQLQESEELQILRLEDDSSETISKAIAQIKVFQNKHRLTPMRAYVSEATYARIHVAFGLQDPSKGVFSGFPSLGVIISKFIPEGTLFVMSVPTGVSSFELSSVMLTKFELPFAR